MIFGGFVKLERNILNWKWYGNANTMRVFIHLLLIANYEDREFEQMVIRRGQAAVSYAHLADTLKLSIQQVRTAVEHLKSTGEITCRGCSKFTLITVNNYDAYQSVNRQSSKRTTSHQQAGQQSVNNNGRNNKNYKERKEYAAASSALSDKVIEEPPEGVVFPEGITNMADYIRYLEE